MSFVSDFAEAEIESIEFDSNFFRVQLDDNPLAGPQSLFTKIARPVTRVKLAGIATPITIAPAGEPLPFAKDVTLIAALIALGALAYWLTR